MSSYDANLKCQIEMSNSNVRSKCQFEKLNENVILKGQIKMSDEIFRLKWPVEHIIFKSQSNARCKCQTKMPDANFSRTCQTEMKNINDRND